jgi:hypothetical protein
MNPANTARPRGSEADVVEWEHVAVRVQAELGSRLRDFEVLASSDGLILRGRASTYYAKQLAQHAVMRIGRRRIVANEIDVC